jgi:hypothetical protein
MEMRPIYVEPIPQLEGKKRKKGKKRQNGMKHDQDVHSTKNGLGRVGVLREKKNARNRIATRS